MRNTWKKAGHHILVGEITAFSWKNGLRNRPRLTKKMKEKVCPILQVHSFPAIFPHETLKQKRQTWTGKWSAKYCRKFQPARVLNGSFSPSCWELDIQSQRGGSPGHNKKNVSWHDRISSSLFYELRTFYWNLDNGPSLSTVRRNISPSWHFISYVLAIPHAKLENPTLKTEVRTGMKPTDPLLLL